MVSSPNRSPLPKMAAVKKIMEPTLTAPIAAALTRAKL